MKPVIVIPALNPDGHLPHLVEDIDLAGGTSYQIVIVDDGSSSESLPIFRQLAHEFGCTVLHHKENRGKGAALKTAFAYVQKKWPGSGCVTADADGQHSTEDILAVADALEKAAGTLLLGTRDFGDACVPFKSRWGNRISALLFRRSTGLDCPDTQTGLRGIPAAHLEAFLQVPGERFEYEMNLLFYAAKNHIPVQAIPIHTIYRDGNSHSHFRALRDSLRVYAGFVRYGLSSLASAGLDLSFFALFLALFGNSTLLVSAATVAARTLSGGANFLLNKTWVFRSKGNGATEGGKYLALFLAQMVASALLTGLLSQVLPAMAAKILVDSALFIASYAVQSRFIWMTPWPRCSKT